MKLRVRVGGLAAGIAAGALLGAPPAMAAPEAPAVQPGTSTQAPATPPTESAPATPAATEAVEPAAQPGTATQADKPAQSEPQVQPGTATEAPAPAAEKPGSAPVDTGQADAPAVQPGAVTEKPAPTAEKPEPTPAVQTAPAQEVEQNTATTAGSSEAQAPDAAPVEDQKQNEEQLPTPAEAQGEVPASSLTGRISVSGNGGSGHAEATVDRQWQLTHASMNAGQASVTVDVANGSVAVDIPSGSAKLTWREPEQLKAAREAFDAEVARAAQAVARTAAQPVQQASGELASAQRQVQDDVFDAVAESAPASASVTVGQATVSAAYDADSASTSSMGA